MRRVPQQQHEDYQQHGDEPHGAKSVFSASQAWWHAGDVWARIVQSESKLVDSGTRFASTVSTTPPAMAAGTTSSTSRCVYWADPPRRLTPVDYAHRQKRRHEFSSVELAREVSRIAQLDALKTFYVYHHSLPVSIANPPVQLSTSFNISVPFGSWDVAFHPTAGDSRLVHNSHSRAPPEEKKKPRHLVKFMSPQKMDVQPPLWSAVFSHAAVSHGHVITCDGYALTAGGCLWDFHLPKVRSEADVRRVPLAIALCDEWCKGYYHFTHEHLPRVALVHALLTQPNSGAQLVLSHKPNGFQRQFLHDVLGISEARVSYGEVVVGDRVVYPMPQRCGNTFTHLLGMLRGIVYRRLNMSHRTSGDSEQNYRPSPQAAATTLDRKPALRLLFAERKHLSRMPSNYNDLKSRLLHDFAGDFLFATTTGDSDAKHQVTLFHSADIVLGPHGANLANMMWMRSGRHVIEMASWRKGNMCYYSTAARLNLTHHLVLHAKGKDAVYTLDYPYLFQHVAFARDQLLSMM